MDGNMIFFKKEAQYNNLKNKKQSIYFIILTLWSVIIGVALGYPLRPAYIITFVFIILTLSNISLIFSKVIIIAMTLIAALYYPISKNYGYPNINIIAAFRYTSPSETVEFINKISTIDYLACLFILLLGFICCCLLSRFKKLSSNSYKWFALISIIIISFGPVKAYVKNKADDEKIKFTPFRFFYDIYKSTKLINHQEERTKELKKIPDSWSPNTLNKEYNTYILVIGESVRRDYMSAYGFPIKNTPFASKANGIFFNNYISSSFATVPSLTNSLYLRENGKIEYNNSIIRLAKKAGMYTYWLSNQGRFGIYDGPVAEIGKEADKILFIKKGDSNDGESYPDTNLTPEISDALKDKRNKLIVIHLIGSHPDACVRVNHKYDIFHGNKNISCYIQSIKNTDMLLSKITSIANANKQRWTMMYFSDHGLSFFKKGEKDMYLEHDDKSKQNFEVPFFITSYDSKSRININSPRSGLDFLTIFSQWSGINEPKLFSSCNYLSEQNCTPKIKVINKNLKMQDFNSLADDPTI